MLLSHEDRTNGAEPESLFHRSKIRMWTEAVPPGVRVIFDVGKKCTPKVLELASIHLSGIYETGSRVSKGSENFSLLSMAMLLLHNNSAQRASEALGQSQ